jgi:hypothetical protein
MTEGINITIPNIIYSKQGLETLLLNETFVKKRQGYQLATASSISSCIAQTITQRLVLPVLPWRATDIVIMANANPYFGCCHFNQLQHHIKLHAAGPIHDYQTLLL